MNDEAIYCDDLSGIENINGFNYKLFGDYWWEIDILTGEILGEYGYKLANLTTLH